MIRIIGDVICRRDILDCGGKRSATPLSRNSQFGSSLDIGASESGVAASLCHRSPKKACCRRLAGSPVATGASFCRQDAGSTLKFVRANANH
jgi:hypothetical protein